MLATKKLALACITLLSLWPIEKLLSQAAPRYCRASAGDASYEYISRVSLNGQSISSGTPTRSSDGRYYPTTNPPFLTTLSTATTYQISVEITVIRGAFGQAIGVWIDLDGDGRFQHPQERVTTAFVVPWSTQTVNARFNMPSCSPVLTNTRLRVILHHGGAVANLNPCQNHGSGEVEDYLVNVSHINVRSVAPTSNDVNISTNEDIGLAINNISFTSGDPNNTFLGITVQRTYGRGNLLYFTNPVARNSFIPAYDLSNGELIFRNALNENGNNYARFSFRVHDCNEVVSRAYNYNISVLPVDDPLIIESTPRTIPEHSPNGTFAGEVEVTNLDIDILEYDIVGGNTGNAFSVDNLGRILVADSVKADFEIQPTFNLDMEVTEKNRADNSVINTYNHTVRVTLTDISLPPVSRNATFSVRENELQGTTIGTIDAYDKDFTALTFRLVSSQAGDAYRVDMNTGRIYINTSRPDTLLNGNSYELMVEITGIANNMANYVYTIHVMRPRWSSLSGNYHDDLMHWNVNQVPIRSHDRIDVVGHVTVSQDLSIDEAELLNDSSIIATRNASVTLNVMAGRRNDDHNPGEDLGYLVADGGTITITGGLTKTYGVREILVRNNGNLVLLDGELHLPRPNR